MTVQYDVNDECTLFLLVKNLFFTMITIKGDGVLLLMILGLLYLMFLLLNVGHSANNCSLLYQIVK